MFRGVVFAQQTKFLEQLHRLVHKFFHFTHLKYIFSILHSYFYKTLTSICLFHTFIQIKYSFLYPHSHRPTPTIHTDITPESTQPTGRKQEKQAKWIKTHTGIDASPWAKWIKVVLHRNWRLALSNKIDAFSGDGENEKQDRRLQRQAVAMARDIQPHSTWNPLIKPIQPENNEKQRKKERSATAAASMAIDKS